MTESEGPGEPLVRGAPPGGIVAEGLLVGGAGEILE
jgi:hypothetical protein